MELRHAAAPYFRQRESIKSIGLTRLAAAAVLLVPPLCVHGLRCLLLAGAGVLGAVVVEMLWCYIRRSEQTIGDFSAIYTGILCALLLPAAVPLWLPMAAGIFSAMVVKLPFGGLGRSPFCGAAGGYCFAAMIGARLTDSYNSALLSVEQQMIFEQLPSRCFAAADGILPVFSDVRPASDVSDMMSSLMQLRTGLQPDTGLASLLLLGGRGAMGALVPAVTVVCALWMLLRRGLAWQSTVLYAGTVAVLSLLAPWSGVESYFTMPLWELLSGSALLCAVFLAGDILTAPHTGSGRALYGLCAGVLTVIFRRVGSTEGGEVFALLLMNAAASPIDHFVFYCRGRGISLAAYRHKVSAFFRKRFGAKARFDIDVDELYEELEREKKERRNQGGDGR